MKHCWKIQLRRSLDLREHAPYGKPSKFHGNQLGTGKNENRNITKHENSALVDHRAEDEWDLDCQKRWKISSNVTQFSSWKANTKSSRLQGYGVANRHTTWVKGQHNCVIPSWLRQSIGRRKKPHKSLNANEPTCSADCSIDECWPYKTKIRNLFLIIKKYILDLAILPVETNGNGLKIIHSRVDKSKYLSSFILHAVRLFLSVLPIRNRECHI